MSKSGKQTFKDALAQWKHRARTGEHDDLECPLCKKFGFCNNCPAYKAYGMSCSCYEKFLIEKYWRCFYVLVFTDFHRKEAKSIARRVYNFGKRLYKKFYKENYK